jgi:hypothetical protein
MRKRTIKLWRLDEDGRKLFAGTTEAATPAELVVKWSAFLTTSGGGETLAVGPMHTLASYLEEIESGVTR